MTSLLLSLDTSSSVLSAGLYQDAVVLSETTLESDSQRYHSSMLMPTLEQLFQSAGKTQQDLTALAIHVGPGSFTGIRTGLISTRALGQFLPLTCYAVHAFELMAFQAHLQSISGPLDILLDARRGRAYYAKGYYDSAKKSFQWDTVPCLTDINAIELTEDSKIICTDSLSTGFNAATSLSALFTTMLPSQVMAKAIQENPEHFKRDWQDLLPLYLEEPNITLPKKSPAILNVNANLA